MGIKKCLLSFFGILFCTIIPARGDVSPPGCLGSGLNVALYTTPQIVHVGDVVRYDVVLFNGAFPVCDATAIQSGIVTPDGITHSIPLTRTTLLPGESDTYSDVAGYVVRASDVQPNGIVLASAFATGTIHQGKVSSLGGGNQSVNSIVSAPCILLDLMCTGSIASNGNISFTGTITNCGNAPLVNVSVSHLVNKAEFAVPAASTLSVGEVSSFSGTWQPLNLCATEATLLTVKASDKGVIIPIIVTSSANSGAACLKCNGVPFPGAVSDCCGVCGGDGTSCLDCAKVPLGKATMDHCGVCNGGGTTCELSCVQTVLTPSKSAKTTSKNVMTTAKILSDRVQLFAIRASRCGDHRFLKNTSRGRTLLAQITTLVKANSLQSTMTQCSNSVCINVKSTKTKQQLQRIAQVLYEVQLSTKRGATAACPVVNSNSYNPNPRATKYYFIQLTNAIKKLSGERIQCS